VSVLELGTILFKTASSSFFRPNFCTPASSRFLVGTSPPVFRIPFTVGGSVALRCCNVDLPLLTTFFPHSFNYFFATRESFPPHQESAKQGQDLSLFFYFLSTFPPGPLPGSFGPLFPWARINPGIFDPTTVHTLLHTGNARSFFCRAILVSVWSSISPPSSSQSSSEHFLGVTTAPFGC